MPPNLIQSTSAAFLSLVHVSLATSLPSSTQPVETPIKAMLLLLPSPNIPPARSSELCRSSAGSVFAAEYTDEGLGAWSREMMQGVDACMLEIGGAKVNRVWKTEGSKGDTSVSGHGGRGRKGDVGDGGMYI